MIDIDQLRDLGWSDDLISEVTRISKIINPKIGSFHPIGEPVLHRRSISGTTLYLSKIETKTNFRLLFKPNPQY